jgi:hypothetical protein
MTPCGRFEARIFIRKTELLGKAEGFEITASIVRNTVIGETEEEK